MTPDIDPRIAELIKTVMDDRPAAHEVMFRHRHKNTTPGFHKELINLWHDQTCQKITIQAFRGAAKSTVGTEEATIIMALLGEFKNGLIIGEKYERAVERLNAIKHEIETNEFINQVFGNCTGEIWTEGKISLRNGTVIQAYGRGQSLRGSKHLDQRPDYLAVDDVEDLESVRSEESRRATLSWLMSVVLPAMDTSYVARCVGTPLEKDSLMEKLEKDEGWLSKKYPIEYTDLEGTRHATWPDRFNFDEIDRTRKTFERMGMLLEYGREYLCEARSGETRVFTRDIIRVKPRIRQWHPTYVMYDPARTVKNTSAHTGKVVFSWIGNELVFWEGEGKFWRPDEIVKDIFDTNDKYFPCVIGVEKTGLEEFIMQPIRQEASLRNQVIPIKPLDAPKGKLDFIRGLQPFFLSGEATLNDTFTEMIEQFMNFPAGRIDIPNAAAYALKMRPGLPVYEDFCGAHVQEPRSRPSGKYICAMNFKDGIMTGVLLRREKGKLIIYEDNVMEGDPQQRTQPMLEWACASAGGGKYLEIIVHKDHYERYSQSGFVGALRKFGVRPRQGGECVTGRGWIVQKLQNRKEGTPDVVVASAAQWTLNGFAGGYAFEFPKPGKGLSDRAPEGVYRVLMEGLEAACALSITAFDLDQDEDLNWQTTPNGKRYLALKR